MFLTSILGCRSAVDSKVAALKSVEENVKERETAEREQAKNSGITDRPTMETRIEAIEEKVDMLVKHLLQ